MNNLTKLSALIIFFVVLGLVFFRFANKNQTKKPTTDQTNLNQYEINKEQDLNDLSIENLRRGNYPGSEITIEEKLTPGSNYQRYIASYKSENLKIYALLTIPDGMRPKTGWPAIIFNHGYIPPREYRTTERYIAYTDGFSRNGYIVFRPDYRGNGSSEGQPTGAYGSNGYTIDVLNAVASIGRYKDTDPSRIGMWGHSMGGFITLRDMVVAKDVKASVIWAGVVADYNDLLNNWRRSRGFTPPPGIPSRSISWRTVLIAKYGTPTENPSFWNSLSANHFLKDVSGPIQLHHGTGDSEVPYEFSQKLSDELKAAGKTEELYLYTGDDHNITNNFNLAMQRSISFFDKYVKGGVK